MDTRGREFPSCDAGKECNCIAVFMENKVISADIFGTAEVYGYYFPMLRDSAFRMAAAGRNVKSPDMHEAYYRVLEAIDGFRSAARHAGESYRGAGAFKIAENDDLVGFELTIENQVIHDVFFAK